MVRNSQQYSSKRLVNQEQKSSDLYFGELIVFCKIQEYLLVTAKHSNNDNLQFMHLELEGEAYNKLNESLCQQKV